MIRTIGPARLGFAAALLALLLGPLALGFHTAHAQVGPDTASFYGQNLSEGDAVTASIDGTECGSATATAEGWVIPVGPRRLCARERRHRQLHGQRRRRRGDRDVVRRHAERGQPDRRGHARADS